MAQTSVTIHVNSAPSTSVVFTPSAPSFTAPVPVGTVVGRISYEPATWAGDISISGPDASFFTADTDGNVRAAKALTVRPAPGGYNIDIATSP